MSDATIFIRRLIPSGLISTAKRLRRWAKRRRWSKNVESGSMPHLSKKDLAEQLRRLGVIPGRDLMVHSALSTLGFVEGGPATVVEALREVVGENATLLMPCYPMKQNMLETMKEPGCFDVVNDESTMGKITRIFMAASGTRRSAHPTHSVAANGPRSTAYTENHHKSVSPCGSGSPFQLLSEFRGDILCLGSGIGKVTSHHTIEDMVDEFPIDVYLEGTMTKRVKFPDGHEESIVVRVHNPALINRRIDRHEKKELETLERMRALNIVKENRVGAAMCYLFSAHDLDELHRSGLQTGITIYAELGG